MFGFGEPTSCAKLASEVLCHAGVHVGLTIFECISCPPLARMRHLLCLRHRKLKLRIVRLDIKSLLDEVSCLDGLFPIPVGRAFGECFAPHRVR